jgi:hypothetical protein
MQTKPQSKRKVPDGSLLFLDKPRRSKEEIARRKAENKAFGQRCQVIFDQVASQLRVEHYDWSIIIEPDSGDYFIGPNSEECLQKAKQKHPTAILMEMCLNETGACGRI